MAEETSIGRDEMIRLLSDLVSIESVNPYFPGGTRAEAGMNEFVTSYCQKLGVPVQQQDVLPGRSNVVAELKVPGATKTLIFESHMDTVSIDLMGERGLRPEVVGNTLTGRGSCDTKASMAGMLAAFKRLVENPTGLRCNVIMLAIVDEEYLMRGIKHFAKSVIKADAAIVGEPTKLDVVIAHKGFVRWHIDTVGRSAHSANPDVGDNAIYQMSEVIRYLRQHLEPKLRTHTHPLCGQATWSIGKIWGGQAVNIVPEKCTIEIDRRVLPNETWKGVLAEVDAVLEDMHKEHPNLHVVRQDPFVAEDGLDTPADAPITRAIENACGTIRGKTQLVGVPYGTDASSLAAAGIACVVFGPGDIKQAHTAEEFVPIDELVAAANIYEQTARGF